MNRGQSKPDGLDFHPRDRVTIDSGTTEYEVVAVSRAGQDVYVREADSRMAGGTWVSIESVRKISMRPSDNPHDFVRSDNPNFGSHFGGACNFPLDGNTCGWPESAHPGGGTR